MAFKMKGNPLQRNFFQRALGLGKKSKRPRQTGRSLHKATGTGVAFGTLSQAPAPTTTGGFVSALGMKSPAKNKVRGIGPHNPAHDTVGDSSDAAHNTEEFKKLDPPKPKPKNPFEQRKGKGKGKRTVSYPSAQIEMENRTGTRGMIRGTRTEVVRTKGGGKKKGKGKKMKLRGSGRNKTKSVRNLVTGGKNITSGRTGRTKRG